jgi:bacterioferritin
VGPLVSIDRDSEESVVSAAQTARGILAPDHDEHRERIITLLTRAYWMEVETVMSYIAGSINPDGIRAQQVVASLEADVDEELGHVRRFAHRIKELYGVVPGSMDFRAEQARLQPPEHQTDLEHVIRGVIDAETAAIDLYNEIIEETEAIDPTTQDMVVEILRDEERHRRLFEGYLREYAAGRRSRNGGPGAETPALPGVAAID